MGADRDHSSVGTPGGRWRPKLAGLGYSGLVLHPRVVQGVKFDGTRNTDSSTALYFVDEIEHFPDILIGFTPLANISLIMGNQLFWLPTRNPSRTTLGQSSIENGCPCWA